MVDITPQEEVPQEETPREEMVAPIDNALAEKIYKTIEDHGEVLKKMGSHLSKLEESKLKKPMHLEINEEEEKKEWDEREKANYERNKQFEKLATETIAMKEKMETMQLTFHRAQGIDDCLYNMGGLNSKAPVALAPKFKISNAKKFNRIEDLKHHVRRYISIVEIVDIVCPPSIYMPNLENSKNVNSFTRGPWEHLN